MSIKTILLAAISLGLLGATPAWACSCTGQQGCRAKATMGLSPDSVVFVGTVTAIGAPASSRPGKGLGGPSESPVEFRVTEMLSGGKETTITGFNPVNTSCAVAFEVGRSYLIHAQAGDMTVGTCNVQEPRAAQTQIVQLRAARDRLVVPDLLGMVTLPLPVRPLYQSDLDALMANLQPAADVPVIVRTGSSEYRTRTGRDGRYEFRGLPPAQYQVTVTPPEGTTLPEYNVFLNAQGLNLGAGMSCGVDIQLYHDTLLSVTVVDAKGMLLAGEVTAKRTDILQPYSSSGVRASGTFQFRGLPPGRYRFEFIPSLDGSSRLDFQKHFSDPQEVAIKNGERLEKRFEIP